MKISLLAGIALLVLTASCVNSVGSVINPNGIESGLAEVLPLNANTGLTIVWNDAGIINVPYFGLALVEASSAPRTDYKIRVTTLAITPTSAAFSLSLSGGWIKLVYRWIASKGEPIVTSIVTLGATASGPQNVPLPSGIQSTFTATSIERIDTLITGFDYTNSGTNTGIRIEITPIIPTKDATVDDYITSVDSVTNQLVPPPITTFPTGAKTLNLQVTLGTGAVLNHIAFTVIFHTLTQKQTMSPDVVTGYGVPSTTQSAILSILNEQKNRLSVVDPEAIYGASGINFPDNSPSGIDFRIELPQAQTISARFDVPVTLLTMGAYMYTLRFPCGTGGDVTSGFKVGTAGTWTRIGSPDGIFTQYNSNSSLYLKAEKTPGPQYTFAGELTGGFPFQADHTYDISFDLSYALDSSTSFTFVLGTQRFTFDRAVDNIPLAPAKKIFSIRLSNENNPTVQVEMQEPQTQPAGTIIDMLISSIQIIDNGGVLRVNPATGVTECYPGSPPCNIYNDPFVNPPTPLVPSFCRDCTPNPLTGINGCQCPSGYYSSVAGQTSTCLLCQVGYCKSCTPSAIPPAIPVPTPLTCTVCDYGRIVSGGQCVCPAGTTPSPLGPCITCGYQCATCDSTVGCLTCKLLDGGNPTRRNATAVQGTCPCQEGFFDTGVAVCSPCNPACRTCVGTSGACTSCKPNSNTVLSGSACVCASGFTQTTPFDGTCYKCDITCLTCQGPSQSDCLTCPTTRDLFSTSSGPGVCYCIVGFTEQNPRQADCIVGNCSLVTVGCTNCAPSGCTQCSESLNFNPTPVGGACQCKSGFYFNAPTNTCVQCPAGCLTCGAGGVCNLCYQGAVLSGGSCTCPVGTYPRPSTTSCANCAMLGCATCQSDICTACQNPWQFVSGTCVCPDRTYLSNNQCVNCSTNCRLCNSSGCNSCVTPNFLLNNVCFGTCPVTFVGIAGACLACPTNCRVCTSQTTCDTCSSGFYLYAGSCVSACPSNTLLNTTTSTCIPCATSCSTCSGNPNFCTSCSSNSGFLFQGTCVPGCPSMTTAVEGVCLSCDPSCATCFGSQTFCSSCAPPNLLYRGTCVLTCPSNTFLYRQECVEVCPTGTYPNVTNCANCSFGCAACNNSNSCTQCPATSFLFNGSCVTTCPASTLPNIGSNGGVCLGCPLNCVQCLSPSNCSTCLEEYQLINGSCLRCFGSTVLNPATGQCVPCPANCLSCVNSTYCSSCNPVTVATNGQCVPCLSPCQTCNGGATICATCIQGYALAGVSCTQTCPIAGQTIVNGRCLCITGFQLGDRCVQQCPIGTGPTALRICENCSPNCNNCSISASVCEQCRIGFRVDPFSRNNCTQDIVCPYGQVSASGTCIRLCNLGTLFYEGFCFFVCPTGFAENTDRSGCVLRQAQITCQVGQVSYLGRCIDSCPSGTYKNGGTCFNCSINCDSCLNSSYCLTCSGGFYFSSGSCILSSICAPPQLGLGQACVTSCPYGTYSTGSICQKGCDADLLFYNRWCYQRCPAGLMSNGYGCVANCPAGQTQIDGTCRGNSNTGCPSGSFLSGSTCLPCRPPCATCVGQATVCTSCVVGSPIRGQCRGRERRDNDDGRALRVNIGRSILTENQLEVELNVNIPAPNLSTAQLNQFFIVVVPNSRREIRVYQWATRGGSEFHVLVQFDSHPSPNTLVLFRLNIAALASAYAELGVADFNEANTQMTISEARRGQRRVETHGLVPTFAQNERTQATKLV